MTDPSLHHASHFGFQSVSPETKTERVQDVFETVAPHYDLMNDLMSLGIHRLWKHRLIQRLNLAPDITLVDMAGGTGDIAMGCYAWLQKRQMLGSRTRLIVCDQNPHMLRVGERRAWDRGILKTVEWAEGDACALSGFQDQSVDLYVVAFGLRNVTHLEQALTEARRVLKPDGRFYCLEFSPLASSGRGSLYRRYLFDLIPKMGGWVTGHEKAYQYLAESIASFPKPSVVNQLLMEAGFGYIACEPWTQGVVSLHRAWGFRL